MIHLLQPSWMACHSREPESVWSVRNMLPVGGEDRGTVKFKTSHSTVLLIAFALLLTVTAVSQEARVGPAAPQEVPVAAAHASNPKMVRISAGDLVEITVLGVPELSRTTRVNASGEISLPLVGALQIANLTTEQAQTKIAEQFEAQNYLRNPQVSIFVKEHSSQGISVLGEVARPGIYPLFGSVRLLDAISAAGGLTQRAGKRVVVTHRDPAVPAETVMLDNASETPNFELSPGDTVQVYKAGVVYVVGNVEKPGGFIMDNNENLTVLQAIALAQGTSRTAALDKALLIRTTPAGRQEIPVPLKKILASKSPDVSLKADDIIFVPSSTSKNVARRTVDAVLATLPGVAVYTAAR